MCIQFHFLRNFQFSPKFKFELAEVIFSLYSQNIILPLKNMHLQVYQVALLQYIRIYIFKL